jgi:hypothetical protein
MKMNNIYISEYAPIDALKSNEENPRDIDDVKFGKLVASIRHFPKMLDIRPIVIDEDGIILGGNMRYKACIEAGMSKVPVMRVDNLTDEQKKEFIIKDNVSFGNWDWSKLSKGYDAFQLDEWALDLDSSMFTIEPDDEPIQETNDSSKYHDYTIFFSSESELDIWYAFIRNLKDRFSEHENVSELILRYVKEVYDGNEMETDSQRILRLISYGLEDK